MCNDDGKRGIKEGARDVAAASIYPSIEPSSAFAPCTLEWTSSATGAAKKKDVGWRLSSVLPSGLPFGAGVGLGSPADDDDGPGDGASGPPAVAPEAAFGKGIFLACRGVAGALSPDGAGSPADEDDGWGDGASAGAPLVTAGAAFGWGIILRCRGGGDVWGGVAWRLSRTCPLRLNSGTLKSTFSTLALPATDALRRGAGHYSLSSAMGRGIWTDMVRTLDGVAGTLVRGTREAALVVSK